MLSEGVVMIVPFTGSQCQALGDLALKLHIFPDLTRLGVRGGVRRDIRPAPFLLSAEDGLVAVGNGPSALIFEAAVVAPVAVALRDGTDGIVIVRVLRGRIFVGNTILQVLIEQIEVEAGVIE